MTGERGPARDTDRRRIRFAEEIVDNSGARRPAARPSQGEEEQAKKAANAKRKTRGAPRSFTEEDDEVEAYEDILRRIKR